MYKITEQIVALQNKYDIHYRVESGNVIITTTPDYIYHVRSRMNRISFTTIEEKMLSNKRTYSALCTYITCPKCTSTNVALGYSRANKIVSVVSLCDRCCMRANINLDILYKKYTIIRTLPILPEIVQIIIAFM